VNHVWCYYNNHPLQNYVKLIESFWPINALDFLSHIMISHVIISHILRYWSNLFETYNEICVQLFPGSKCTSRCSYRSSESRLRIIMLVAGDKIETNGTNRLRFRLQISVTGMNPSDVGQKDPITPDHHHHRRHQTLSSQHHKFFSFERRGRKKARIVILDAIFSVCSTTEMKDLRRLKSVVQKVRLWWYSQLHIARWFPLSSLERKLFTVRRGLGS